MNSEAIDALIAKNPRLKKARSVLEQMQPGTYCVHRSWGFGQITGYDAGDNKLIIDFEEDKQGHRMDPAFCVDKLELLPDNHLLVRKRKEPEAIEEMIKKQHADLIIEILKELPDQSAPASEIERVLARLMGPIKYKKWWTQAKKHLLKDPRVAVPAKKTEPYILRDEPVKPEEEFLENYTATKQAKQKIDLAEKIFTLSGGKPELKDELPAILEDLTTVIQESKALTMADRLHGVWVRNDLARDLHEDVETLTPTSSSILDATDDLSELAEQLPSQYYKRFLDLITRTYPDEWKDFIEDLLRRSTGKFTSECINFMMERGEEERIARCFQRWLDEQTIRGPVLLWIIKNRNSKKFSNLVQPLMTPRLLAAVFYAIDNEALQNASTRRIPLADLISEDQDLIPDLLSESNTETARDLAQMLLMNQGFDDLTKKSVFARFVKQFPSIQTLLATEAETANEEDTLIVSQASFDRAKAEYEDLVQVKIPENKEAIATAREHGDLKENSEYKMARQDQDTLLARKSQLEVDLGRARVTDFKDAPKDKVGIGSVVDLKGSSGSQRYAILGAWDSDPDKNILSYKTPLGQALLGKSEGGTAETEIDGQKETWTIRGISRWIDEH
ncbi:MAG: GreA/GreB family elongation factor [Opitutales bacterium]